MWSRKELKAKAKQRISVNYWKAVLVALAFALLCGGSGLASSAGGIMNRAGQESPSSGELEEELQMVPDVTIEDGVLTFLFIVFIIVVIFLLVVLFIALPLKIFVCNPMEVGVSRFFTRNMAEQAQAKEVCFAFDHHYKNCVKTLFFRSFHIFLWSLLLFIPGIAKSYEYQMVPYLLADNPELGREEAFALSREMMRGNKWKAFVLDLSFFGWYILNGVTLGILGIFYLKPYVCQTNAALYQTLKEQQAKVFDV